MRIKRATEIKLNRVMNDALMYVLTDIGEKLEDGATRIEVDIVELDTESKMALLDYLEDLGYYVDESYGEDVIHISITD